jgi:nicotinamidase-related amidase
MDALVIVDMQEAAVAQGLQYDLDGVVQRIKRLATRVRTAGGAVIFIQHDGTAGDAFEPGTLGWEVATSMTMDATDTCVRKTVNDAFRGTDLEHMLRCLDVARVIICGWATDFCVDSTVRSAVARCSNVVVAADCHTLHDRPHLPAAQVIEHHNWVWANLIAPGSVSVAPEKNI